MMKRFISLIAAGIFILATLPVIAPAPAQAWIHGTASGTCPYGTGSGDNGCSGSSNGSFKDATLLTAAQQSQQISLFSQHSNPANNIVPFNIPAIDYGVGPDSTLTPQDPRNFTDPNCSMVGSEPNLILECFGTTLEHITINNYDFAGTKIGKNPVLLYFGGSPLTGSTITVSNSYIAQPASGTATGYAGNWNVTYIHNQCDGTNAGLSADQCLRDDGLTFGTTIDVEYNAFTNVNAVRVMGGGSNSGVAQTWKYNYIRGLNDLNTTSHGEVTLLSCGSGTNPNCANKTLDHFTAIGNFIISNSLTYAYCSGGGGMGGCVNSATFFLSNGAPHGIYVTNTTMSNNVAITNTVGANGGGPATPSTGHMWGVAGFSGVWPTDSLTATNNWIDGTGATACFTNGPSNALNSTTASVSGNTINLISFGGNYGNNPIDVGWVLHNPGAGFTDAKITAYGTGTGAAGTYTFGGPSQGTIASTGGWTVVPYIGSLTSSGNKSLADPTNTGIAASIDPSGYDLSANCPGAHN